MKKRASAFNKGIKIKMDQFKFIKEEKERLKYKTYAGVLDKIINFYKKHNAVEKPESK